MAVGYGKRGKALENLIDYSNNQYRLKGIARIDKIPTNWNVFYDKRTKRVRNAFPEKKGTVDYIGVCKGVAVAFDAKNTKNKTSFPLGNIQEHQFQYLSDFEEFGGVGFILVSFEKHDRYFVLNFDDLSKWWMNATKGGRKSIPYDYFDNQCFEVKSENGVALNYLKPILKER